MPTMTLDLEKIWRVKEDLAEKIINMVDLEDIEVDIKGKIAIEYKVKIEITNIEILPS